MSRHRLLISITAASLALALILGSCRERPPSTGTDTTAHQIVATLPAVAGGGPNDALTALLKWSSIAVYRQDGSFVVPGARDGAIVEDQLTALARIQLDDTVPLASWVDGVNAILPEGVDPLASPTLAASLGEAARRAEQSPSDETWRPAALLRELGLRHDPPYDLSKNPSDSQISLDGYQRLIIMAGMVHAVSQPGLTPQRANVEHAEASEQCPQWVNPQAKLYKFWVSLVPYKWVGGVMKLGVVLIDFFQSAILAFSVAVRNVGPIEQDTHLGHGVTNGAYGKPVTFTIEVVMLDKLPDVLTKCGGIPGAGLPPPGGIEGVSVVWPEAAGLPYGTFDCHDSGCEVLTGTDGRASVTFTPRTEQLPGVGEIRESNFMIYPTKVYVAEKFAALLGMSANIGANVLGGGWPTMPRYEVHVGMHAAPGYRIQTDWISWVAKIGGEDHGGAGWYMYQEKWVIDSECGSSRDDPLTHPWKADVEYRRPAVPDNPAYREPDAGYVKGRTVPIRDLYAHFEDHAEGMVPTEGGEYALQERKYFGMDVEIEIRPANGFTYATVSLTPLTTLDSYVQGKRSVDVVVEPNPECLPWP